MPEGDWAHLKKCGYLVLYWDKYNGNVMYWSSVCVHVEWGGTRPPARRKGN